MLADVQGHPKGGIGFLKVRLRPRNLLVGIMLVNVVFQRHIMTRPASYI